MAQPFTHADSIMFQKGAVEVHHHHAGPAIGGILILEAAARNGPGLGRLASLADGRSLTWRPPNESLAGVPVPIPADGDYLLEGRDISKYLRIRAFVAHMHTHPAQARVYLDDVFLNPVALDEVIASEASAGHVEQFTVDIKNVSIVVVSQLTLWIDLITPSLEISHDGVVWVSPTTEATGLKLPNLVPGQIFVLHVKRTIVAGAVANPNILNWLHASFTAV